MLASMGSTAINRSKQVSPRYRIVTGLVVLLLVALFFYNIDTSNTQGHWYSILPPLSAVVLAFVTRRLLSSLLFAVLLAGILLGLSGSVGIAQGIFGGISTSLGYGFKALFDPWSLKILGFVFCILSMISVIIVAGGLSGLVRHLQRFTGDARSSQLTTAILGVLVFIDDYANTMIVGSSMRPVTDQHRISREKLAFIVDATSAPVAGLAIISTWIGYETGLFTKVSQSLHLGIDGYAMFFDALSFRFYCILMLVFVFLNILLQRDFGPMRQAQLSALSRQQDNDTQFSHSGFSVINIGEGVHVSAKTALIPLLLMFMVLLGGLWFDGGGGQKAIYTIANPLAWLDVISHAKNSSTILLLAASTGLLTAIVMGFVHAKTRLELISRAIVSGIRSSLLPVGILVLAWALKSGCDDLHTGEFLANTIGQVLSPAWFPVLLFIVAALTSFGTGTSWGTMAILIPTAIPVAYALDGNQYGLITMISLGAVLDGAIFGDHCSPISDTTIMSSIASGCDHLEHVKTQIPYSLTVAGIAGLCGYILVANNLSTFLAYTAAILCLLIILLLAPRSASLKPSD